MISWKKHLLPLAISGAVLMMVSCSDYTGKEKTHPVFIRAENAKMSGNYRDAAKGFEEFLLICPRSARTHNELGSLYADYLEDPIQAVYHYTRYSELVGPDSGNMEDIRHFIDTCRRSAYEKLKAEFGGSDDAEGLKKSLAQAQNNLGKYEVAYADLKKKYDVAVEQNENMKEIIQKEIDRRSGNTTSTTSTSTGTASTSTGTAITTANTETTTSTTAVTTSGNERTYTVKEGDTLAKISRQFYDSTNFYPVILNANKDLLADNPNKLRVGMVLKIPQKPPTTR